MYKLLFEPGRLGNLTLKNRLTVPAMLTGYANADGTLSERYLNYYEERAKGGFSLIVTEDTAVTSTAGGFLCLPGIWSDAQLPEHRQLVERVHRHGAKILLQIYHAGREAPSVVHGIQSIAPSPLPDPVIGEIPHEMTEEEIQRMIRAFVAAASRAAEAGYDGVEVHAAHGYLINQFLSPFSNRRLDEYGGTEANRMRFLLAIILGIRQTVRVPFVINCKLSVDEFVEGGLTLRDSQRIARQLELAGVDGITASCGVYKSGHNTSAPYYCPSGYLAHLAEGLKQVVSIPVIAIDRINTAAVAEQILCNGQADFVAIGRASIADPYFPQKIQEGRESDLIPCIACDQGCQGNIAKGLPVSCLVNPRTGREGIFDIRPTATPKRVVVAGGGIAGMEAALIAAWCGHHVELYEREDHLGGTWNQAAVPPCKEIFNSLTVYLLQQLAGAGVVIHLNTPLSAAVLDKIALDHLICATGAEPKIPAFPGGEDHPNLVFAIDLLEGKTKYGKNVVVLGGGMVGAETAEHLAVHGSTVTLLARSTIAKDMVSMTKFFLLKSLKENNVTIHEFCDIQQVEPDRVVWKDRESGTEQFALADQVVIALGAIPRCGLMHWAESKHIPSSLIGDADQVEDGVKAIFDGYNAALSI